MRQWLSMICAVLLRGCAWLLLVPSVLYAGQYFHVVNKDNIGHTLWVYEMYRSMHYGDISRRYDDNPRNRYRVDVPAASAGSDGEAWFDPGYDSRYFGVDQHDFLSKIILDKQVVVACDQLPGYVAATREQLYLWIRANGFEPGNDYKELGIQLRRTFTINNSTIQVAPLGW